MCPTRLHVPAVPGRAPIYPGARRRPGGRADECRHRLGGLGRLGVSDPEAGRKNGIANANLRAQVALVDPLLTHSMPPTMTANTGIDALAQAIAAVVAKVRTPIGDAIALEAVRMMTPALLAAYRDGTDAAARSDMSCGSMMAGLAMNISDCTAEHSLGQAIGGVKTSRTASPSAWSWQRRWSGSGPTSRAPRAGRRRHG